MISLIIIAIFVVALLVSFVVGKGKLGKWYVVEIVGAFCVTFGFMIHESLVPSWLYKFIGGGKGILVGCVFVAVGNFMVRFIRRRTNSDSQ